MYMSNAYEQCEHQRHDTPLNKLDSCLHYIHPAFTNCPYRSSSQLSDILLDGSKQIQGRAIQYGSTGLR
jgi:hypothetical protein